MKRFLSIFAFMSVSLIAAEAQIHLEYQKPHKDILELADVPLPPVTIVDDAGKTAIMLYRDVYKSIAELSQEELRLGGLRINPVTNIGSRTTYYTNCSIYNLETGEETAVTGLPETPQLASLSWSPDQSKAAFTHTTEQGVELWIADISEARAWRITTDNLNANTGRPYIWDRDGNGLIIKVLPSDRAELINTEKSIPTGPTISENIEGNLAQNRTYQDLLKNKTDEANFEMLVTSVLHHVDLSGNMKLWRKKGMYRGMIYSPDGNYLMVSEMHRPFSYIVPMGRFPFTTDVYTSDGKFVKTMLDAPLEEDRPKGFMSVRKGIREVQWRDDKPATLAYTVALDDGDAEKEVAFRDEVFELSAPFNGEPKSILKTKDRLYTILWCNDNLAIAYDYWWNTRNVRNYLFNPSDAAVEPRIFHDRNYQDRYNDPGSFVMKRNEYGRSVLALVDGKAYLNGDGFNPNGIHPFIDQFDLETLESERLWQASADDQLETIIDMIDVEKGIMLERIQSKSTYPNYYTRNIHDGGDPVQVTFFENPFKGLQDVHKEVIRYKREDGLELSATLYLPPGYDQQNKAKLPMIMWAYPEEFKDKSSAGQVTSSPNEFTYPWYGSPIYWVMRGYVVLDDASFPIVGEGDEEPNDSFIPQLVSNARSAIDAVDELGYIDRNRVAVGGHSYGAFMTANLLSHSDLFAAGIARSGAYNRTLTPFGFQSEERNYWEAPNIYYEMSPFMHADKMKTPLLLIHGEDDNNSGTYPMQSERYFNALKGLGAPVRLVMLPKESHGYVAKESILHMLWEQDQWLEKWVKNRSKEEKEESRP